MADSVIFVGWSGITAGREKQATELSQKTMEYCTKLQAEGKIESFETVILTPHGGDLNGFMIMRGDAKNLSAIRHESTFLDNSALGMACLDGFGIIEGVTGDGIAAILERNARLFG